MNCIQQHKHTLLFLFFYNNLNFICLTMYEPTLYYKRGAYDVNRNIKWFHVCRLTVYCTFYLYSFRHSGDGGEYDRNMLLIVNK